jgi:hypothetical protein
VARKTTYTPKPFESASYWNDEYLDDCGKKQKSQRKDISANIYMTMLLSQAWQSLTESQQTLYLHCKSQYYGQRKKPNLSPDDEHGSELDFYFNRYLYVTRFKLYPDSNRARFTNDMTALIEKGFIRCLYSGSQSKKKSIYRFSSDWQKYPDFQVEDRYRLKKLSEEQRAKLSESHAKRPRSETGRYE